MLNVPMKVFQSFQGFRCIPMGNEVKESLRFRPHPAAKQTEKHIDKQSPEGTWLNKLCTMCFLIKIQPIFKTREIRSPPSCNVTFSLQAVPKPKIISLHPN